MTQLFQPNLIIQFIKENGTSIQVKKDDYIYNFGDHTDSIYLLISGEVFISRMQPEGIELVTHLLKTHSIFGAVTLFCGPKTFNTVAQARVDCKLIRIEKHKFEEAVYSHQDYTKEWMKWVDLERSRHSTKIRDLIMFGKYGALASVLIRLTNTYGVRKSDGVLIDTKLTNQELAKLIGTSREVVNRYLREMRNEGILSIEKKKITILELEELKRINNCENCDINVCQIF
ncbi:Crp/Fnr family transcriptional regulator [Phocicoccus pinnipedialis]|uniref:Anaerobic regulatory protein n=1 Tax=Phocicoccus pinnipedialis TaxID=110845 RepID=A0A6V7RGR2_9BACL|nr:Crp/Fnr family transcriptional regulator [Jeotgalicoccus pinnipedialis]MBP1939215.1 CRP/FNR family transcriptional regulator [Jeotgalicoccus pinnipedialis]CAD2076276.1 Anaerobic regulatory protein [Jeotgalicoccus pinnipedialis]